MDHQLLLSNTRRHALGRVLPPPNPSPGAKAKAWGTEDSVLPSQCEPRDGTPSPVFSLPLITPCPRVLEDSNKRAHICVPPPELGNTATRPTHAKPPPSGGGGPQNHTLHARAVQDAYDKLSPPLPGPGRPPPVSLMNNTYSTLKKRVRESLLNKWAHLFPMPGYYHHPSALNTRPFMGLGKFVAGCVHQMRAGKSYMAAHPTGRSPDADTCCPRCGLEPATFEHAILSCPSGQRARTRLLHGGTGLCHGNPLWTSAPLLKSLATFICVTSMGFPPIMFPPTTPPSTPPLPLSPPRVPPPVFHIFSLAEV